MEALSPLSTTSVVKPWSSGFLLGFLAILAAVASHPNGEIHYHEFVVRLSCFLSSFYIFPKKKIVTFDRQYTM